MNNNDQETQSRSRRSFAQEMRQVFADWAKTLPFIKKDNPKDPKSEDPKEASASHPTDGVLGGQSMDNKK